MSVVASSFSGDEISRISQTWIEGELASAQELWEAVVVNWQHGGGESTEGIRNESKENKGDGDGDGVSVSISFWLVWVCATRPDTRARRTGQGAR